jgi:hypothetical protein
LCDTSNGGGKLSSFCFSRALSLIFGNGSVRRTPAMYMGSFMDVSHKEENLIIIATTH